MVILGSTGSIGTNALSLAKKFGIKIEALVCGGNIELFNKQIKEFSPKFVGINESENLKRLEPLDSKVFIGEDIINMFPLLQSEKILNAIIGFAGLQYSIKTIGLQKKLILANKESLVIAGGLIKNLLEKQGFYNILDSIFPIDSEHFSLWYLMQNNTRFNKLYISASGGALRDYSLKDIKNATLSNVLKHPTWKMGEKITIDSATLINKLYEILEAFWLFNTTKIDAIIERSSIIHALIEHDDNSISALLSKADMSLPIAYGMGIKKATNSFVIQNLSLSDLCKISFQEIDTNRYPLWKYKDLLLQNPNLGIALNTSNEIIQTHFLQKKLNFGAFYEVIPQVLLKFENIQVNHDMQDILSFKNEVANFVEFLMQKIY